MLKVELEALVERQDDVIDRLQARIIELEAGVVEIAIGPDDTLTEEVVATKLPAVDRR